MLTSRQIFWYAVPARTVTKKAPVGMHANTDYGEKDGGKEGFKTGVEKRM